MTPTRIAYTLETGPRRPTIAVRLDTGAPLPPAALLRLFHGATGAWEQANRGTTVRSALDGVTPSGTVHAAAADYLYADDTFNAQRFQRHLSMLAEHGSIHRFVPHPGAPVEGRDLWGRDRERASLLECIRRGSCHVQAPRRYGKTSLLRSLEQRMARDGRPALLVDVSACANPAEFFTTIVAEAMDLPALRSPLSGVARELHAWPAAGPAADADQRSLARTRLLASIEGDPVRFGGRLFDRMASAQTILMIDEFSLFLRTMLRRSSGETEPLLGLLLEARRRSPPLRQVVAGSAGLTSFARFHGLGDFLEDLTPLPVEPLDVSHGKALAEELIYGAGLRPSPGLAAAVLTDIGPPVPYFIHALCDAARAQAGGAAIVDEATVHAAYRERVLGPVGNQLFRVYRLDHQPYPDSLRRAAACILAGVARSPRGSTRAALAEACRRDCSEAMPEFESLLACLTEDYDLERNGIRWRFRSKALRERWLLFGQTSA